MRHALRAMVLVLLSLTRTTHAGLPPEAYEEARDEAPLSFVGVVLRDRGGRATVRVEELERGYLPAEEVTVRYPLEPEGGSDEAGPDILYRRFEPGTRLRVFAEMGDELTIVLGGIDVLSVPRKPSEPAQGGCASCTVAATASPPDHAAWMWLLATGVALVRRRRISGDRTTGGRRLGR